MILPALTEATGPYWRPIKYSLFPPLGLATLAAYLDPDADISLQDEHVEKLDLDNEPDLVIIQVYIACILKRVVRKSFQSLRTGCAARLLPHPRSDYRGE